MATTDPAPKLLHLAFEADWNDAQRSGAYRISTRGRTLEQVGFIHCSHEHQLASVARSFYADVTEPLVVLTIDTARLGVPVVEEIPDGGYEAFPHIYGPIPIHAVVAVAPACIRDGEFQVTGDALGR